ncbi:MAG: hypothetical protein LRY46_00575 [Candidatus Pacebacteria bacterium]|nr:hypothetical protein [Candidatus Paceibacterota bacterium]
MSLETDFRRIINNGIKTFTRNSVVSAASILIMTVTLFVISTVIFFECYFVILSQSDSRPC